MSDKEKGRAELIDEGYKEGGEGKTKSYNQVIQQKIISIVKGIGVVGPTAGIGRVKQFNAGNIRRQ